MKNDKTECPNCEGKKHGYFSCCTGDMVDPDIQRCPECLENLGEEECPTCEGEGIVDVD
jgi:hypothetical protein